MPYIIRPRRALHRAAASVLGAAMLLVASPVAANAACATGPTSMPFAQFGDYASYTLLAGGSFESGAPGWSLSGAEVIGENESYEVAGGSHSLQIEPNGIAVSPSFCVGVEEPMFRLFARRRDGVFATTTVVLRWSEAGGATHETTLGVGHPEESWAPTPYVGLSVLLPLAAAQNTVTAQLMFLNGPQSAVDIDDVYIDPYRR